MVRISQSKPSKRLVLARVRWWKKRFHLQHWKFTVTFGEDADGADAACMAQPEYRNAALHFDLSKIPLEELDHFVAHELLHTIVWPLANCAYAMAAGDKSKEEWCRTEEESLVTALEKLFVGQMLDG